MTLFLNRIDSVPLQGNDNLTFELQRWMITIVDTLNEIWEQIEALLPDTQTISGTTQLAEINTEYIPTNALQTVITLPEKCIIGSVVSIIGNGAGGWSLNPNTGQTIQLDAQTATVSIVSAEQYDSIMVKCVVENTTWVVTSYVSTGLIVT